MAEIQLRTITDDMAARHARTQAERLAREAVGKRRWRPDRRAPNVGHSPVTAS